MENPTIWAAFLAGVISFMSPCVLPLFPVYLGIAGAGTGSGRMKAVFAGILIMAGFTIMFMAMMGPLVALFGVRLVSSLPWIEPLAGALFIIFGIWILPLEKVPLFWRVKGLFYSLPAFNVRIEEAAIFKRRYARALVPLALGASLAIVWIPCIGPYLGVILLLAGSSDTMFQGLSLLLIYCAGLSVPFLIFAFLLDKISILKSHIGSAGVALKAIAGVLVLGFGIVIVTGNLTWLNSKFVFLGGPLGV